MADLIERSEIVKVAEHAYHEWELAMVGAETNRQVNRVLKMQELCKAVEAVAKAAPAVDAVPVVHAHWEGHLGENGELMPYRTCSKCRYPVSSRYWIDGAYCPNCGAKMDEEEII